ncbi:MAG: ASKHA domain-containing protein [Spirochaetales bacterium]
MDGTKSYTIWVLQKQKEHFGEYGASSHLLDYLSRHSPFSLRAPCGGKGRCGKCKIKVLEGTPSPVTEEEKALLSEEELQKGFRLACLTRPESDLTLALEEEIQLAGNKAVLLSSPLPVDDSLRSLVLELVPPSLEDQRSDHTRILSALKSEGIHLPYYLLQELPQVLRQGNWIVTLSYYKNQVLSLFPGTSMEQTCGVAIDLGTTTVAVYLFDLSTGQQIDAESELNAQEAFGADVISRIQFALEQPENLPFLKEKIQTQINSLIVRMCQRNHIRPIQICMFCLVGNPTMIHLALGLPPQYIAEAPFIPVTTEPLLYPAREFGWSFAPGGVVRIPPSVSAYVGSDILAGALAAGMDKGGGTSILIDLGTNGEIFLSQGGRFLACSTAAGPAFEGAELTCGMGGVAGAIDKVTKKDSSITFTTILSQPPLGFCGAGVVDILALLLEEGLVDDTGRLLSREEAEKAHHPFSPYIVPYEGEPALQLVPADLSATGLPIVFTQQDIREIQLAKAAIAAGIHTLLGTARLSFSDIDTLYIAGGFGNYLNPASALRIGLIPKELQGKIQSLGNAAGLGAAMALLSEDAFARMQAIKERTTYIELSSSLEFQDCYVEQMLFS